METTRYIVFEMSRKKFSQIVLEGIIQDSRVSHFVQCSAHFFSDDTVKSPPWDKSLWRNNNLIARLLTNSDAGGEAVAEDIKGEGEEEERQRDIDEEQDDECGGCGGEVKIAYPKPKHLSPRLFSPNSQSMRFYCRRAIVVFGFGRYGGMCTDSNSVQKKYPATNQGPRRSIPVIPVFWA